MRWALLAGAGVLFFTPLCPAQSNPGNAPAGQLVIVPGAESVADQYIVDHLARRAHAFERRGTYRVASGAVVRYVQRENGVLVRDGGAAVLVSPAGTVLDVNDFSRASLPPAPASVIGTARAAQIARAHVGGDDPGDDAARTFLVWTHEFGFPALVYECDFAPPSGVVPFAPRVLVRAVDGVVLRSVNRAETFRGRVYRANPVTTPDLTDEDLVGLPDGSTDLEGDEVHGFNCVDEGRTYTVAGTRAHLCTPEHTTMPDSTGLYAPDATQPYLTDDPYGELSMYYHVSDYLRFMRTLGFTNFRTRPINVYANVRFPWQDSFGGPSGTGPFTGPLLPWDNAAFIPGTPPNLFGIMYGGGHDVIMFGQGTSVDFAYDGDVIAHESGHSVVASTADFGGDFQDRFGTNNAPGSLNEGVADYFSSARAGDPQVGEYAGAVEGADSIRALDCTNKYPDNLFGEVHNDSQPSSCAYWSLHTMFGMEFDRAVLEAVTMESNAPSHFSLATKIVAAAGRIVGPAAADAATREFTARGIFPEGPRFKRYRSGSNYTIIPGVDNTSLPFVPPYFQFAYTLPAHSTRVRIEMPIYTNYVSTLRFGIKRGAAITYTYPTPDMITSDADAEQTIHDDGTGHPSATFMLTPADADQDLFVEIGMEDGFESFAGPLSITSVQLPSTSDGGTDAASDAHADASSRDARGDSGRGPDGGDRVDVVGGCAARPARNPGHEALPVAASIAALVAFAARRRRARG